MGRATGGGMRSLSNNGPHCTARPASTTHAPSATALTAPRAATRHDGRGPETSTTLRLRNSELISPEDPKEPLETLPPLPPLVGGPRRRGAARKTAPRAVTTPLGPGPRVADTAPRPTKPVEPPKASPVAPPLAGPRPLEGPSSGRGSKATPHDPPPPMAGYVEPSEVAITPVAATEGRQGSVSTRR